MREILDKKGQGHMEMIMSFGLFIGFVITMLFFFKPTVKSREVSLASVQTDLLANLSTDAYFFTVGASAKEGCICFNNPYSVAIGNVIIRNNLREVVPGGVNGDTICVEQNDKDFFYIYRSAEYEGGTSSCATPAVSLGENVGSLRRTESISDSAINALKESYDADYFKLKEEIGSINDFRFALFDNVGNKVMETLRQPALGRPVYSKDLPIEILFKDGETGRYILRIYAW